MSAHVFGKFNLGVLVTIIKMPADSSLKLRAYSFAPEDKYGYKSPYFGIVLYCVQHCRKNKEGTSNKLH